jgi:hypothetical protein
MCRKYLSSQYNIRVYRVNSVCTHRRAKGEKLRSSLDGSLESLLDQPALTGTQRIRCRQAIVREGFAVADRNAAMGQGILTSPISLSIPC